MPYIQFRYLPRSSSFGPTAERYIWSVLRCCFARRAMSCGVTDSMRAEISSGVKSSAPVMTLRPTRFILADVLSRASSVELLSCCLVRTSSSPSTSSSMTLPSCSTITLTASSTLPVVVGVHSVCQTALLTHLLEEAATHTAAQHVVQSGHRVTVSALGRNAKRTQRDVVLLRLLELEEKGTLRCCRLRLPHEGLSTRKAGKHLFDHPFYLVRIELACGDDEDVGSRVGVAVEILEGSVVHPAHRLGRPDNRAAEGVFVEDQRRQILVSELVWPVLVHLDLFDDDLALAFEIGERGPEDHVAHDVEGAPQVLGQKAGVEHGVLLTGRRVLLGSDALEGLGDAEGVHIGGPLEEHVLHQVADTSDLVQLVAGPCPDPEP